MVQIIPKVDSFGTQFSRAFGSGLGQGISHGIQNKVQERSEYKKMSQKQELEKKAISDKFAMLNSPEYAPLFEGLDPEMANLAKATMAGFIQPGVATEMAKMHRLTKQHQNFVNQITGNGDESYEDQDEPSENQDIMGNPGIAGTMPNAENVAGEEGILGGKRTAVAPEAPKPTTQKQPKIDYDKEISRLQNVYQYATNPSDKNELDSKIKELTKLRDINSTKTKASQDRAYKRNEKYLEHLDESRINRRKRQLALNQIGSALKTGNFESFRNKVGAFTGFEFLKDASAQTVNTAAKEFLVGSLSDITGRPNMFLEQAISKAMVNPLYQKEANNIIFEGFELMQDLGNKEDSIARDLENFYTKDGGEIPRNFQQLVQDEVDKYAQPLLESYTDRINQLLETQKKSSEENKPLTGKRVDIMDAQGNVIGDIDESEVDQLGEGYRIK